MATSGARSLAILAVLAACADGSRSHEQVGLSIENVTEQDEIAQIPAGALHHFIQLDATLDNTTSDPVSSSYALFTVTTDQGYVIDGDPLSCVVDASCSPDALLAPGGQATHTLVFHLPNPLHAGALGFGDGLGHDGDAPIP